MKKILNFATFIVFGLFWVSLTMIDSHSWTPFVVFVICWLWLMAAAWKKGWIYKPEEDEADV